MKSGVAFVVQLSLWRFCEERRQIWFERIVEEPDRFLCWQQTVARAPFRNDVAPMELNHVC